jgi:citrate lyase subunit beta-like protein
MILKNLNISNSLRNCFFLNKSFYSSQITNYKRAVLYVPGISFNYFKNISLNSIYFIKNYFEGSDKKKIQKALTLGADCTVIDCEDGVAVNRKQEARENIRDLLRTTNKNDLTVRINSVQSNLAFDDLKCIFDAENKPTCIFVPKTDEFDQIKWLFEKLDKLSNSSRFNLYFYMESAVSLLNLRDLILNSIKLSQDEYSSKYNIEGVVFGSDDYCADIGATRTKDALELSFARQYLVTVCKSFKIQAVDMVFIDYKGF